MTGPATLLLAFVACVVVALTLALFSAVVELLAVTA